MEGIAFAYANKWPQSFADPQWGQVLFSGSDSVGMAAQVKLPSALGGDILIDFPYAYFPFGEYYAVAGGQLFSNASRTNVKSAVGVDDTDRSAGFPLLTGQSLNLPGDPGTGIGITGVPAGPPVYVNGAAGACYRDANIPQLQNGFTAEWEAALNAGPTTINGVVDIFRVIGFPGNYTDYASVDGINITVSDGTRLLITITRLSGEPGITATLAGYGSATIMATSPNGIVTDNLTHQYAVTTNCNGSGVWTITVYMDGVQVGTASSNAVEATPTTYLAAMGPVLLGGGTRRVGNYILGQVAMYGSVLDYNRIAAHAATASTAGSGETITSRYSRLHAWSGAQLPKAITPPSPSPLAGNADQIQGQALSDAAYNLTVADGGMYYADAQGNNWLATRTWFYNRTPKFAFGDTGAANVIPCLSADFDFSDTFLFNITSSQRTISASTQLFIGNNNQASSQQFDSYGATATAEDQASEAQYLPRGPLQQNIETTSDQDAFDRANWSLAKYKQPVLRANQILIDPASNPAAWPAALAVEQGDIVTVIRNPLGAADITVTCIVQKVEHSIGPSKWQVTLTLAPYFPEGAVVQLDSPSFGTPSSGVLPW
jgi:hypothetical protein